MSDAESPARIAVRFHCVIVSRDKYESLAENLNILGDEDTMATITQGEADFTAGEFTRLDEL